MEEIVGKGDSGAAHHLPRSIRKHSECWFYEPGKPKRRLSVNIIGEVNAGLDAPATSPEFVVMAIRPLGRTPCPWHVISSDSTCVHDGCHDVEDAKGWIRNTVTRYKDHSPILLLVFNEADRMDEAWSLRRGGWRKLPLKVKHPEPGKNPFLYDGCRQSSDLG